MKEELVSVIVPTFNRKATIKRCIDSILCQTYRNFEIIIVDDCSTDGTMEFIERQYGMVTDIDIIYVRNDTNVGAAASRNIGAGYANGGYIAFHDSDDEWKADKLARQMSVFQNEGEKTGAVYSVFKRVWNVGVDYYPPESIPLEYKTGFVYPFLLMTPLVGMITLIVKRDVFFEVGGFQDQLNALEDYELTIRIAKHYHITLINEVLATAYESDNSVGKRNDDKIIAQCYILKTYSDDLAALGLKRRKFEAVYQEAAMYGNEGLYLECLLQVAGDREYTLYAGEKIL